MVDIFFVYRIGILLGFISNAQLSSSLKDLTASADASLSTAFDYARHTIDVKYRMCE